MEVNRQKTLFPEAPVSVFTDFENIEGLGTSISMSLDGSRVALARSSFHPGEAFVIVADYVDGVLQHYETIRPTDTDDIAFATTVVLSGCGNRLMISHGGSVQLLGFIDGKWSKYREILPHETHYTLDDMSYSGNEVLTVPCLIRDREIATVFCFGKDGWKKEFIESNSKDFHRHRSLAAKISGDGTTVAVVTGYGPSHKQTLTLWRRCKGLIPFFREKVWRRIYSEDIGPLEVHESSTNVAISETGDRVAVYVHHRLTKTARILLVEDVLGQRESVRLDGLLPQSTIPGKLVMEPNGRRFAVVTPQGNLKGYTLSGFMIRNAAWEKVFEESLTKGQVLPPMVAAHMTADGGIYLTSRECWATHDVLPEDPTIHPGSFTRWQFPKLPEATYI